MMFSTAIEGFLKALGAARYSPRTLSSYAPILRDLREHVAAELGREPEADEIDRNAINSHGRERMKQVGRPAMDQRLYTLRSFFKWLEAAHGIANPMRDMATPRAVPARLRGAISPEQVASIIAVEERPGARSWHEPRDRALVEVLYGSGIRISEAINLNWEDLGGGETWRCPHHGGERRRRSHCYNRRASARRARGVASNRAGEGPGRARLSEFGVVNGFRRARRRS